MAMKSRLADGVDGSLRVQQQARRFRMATLGGSHQRGPQARRGIDILSPFAQGSESEGCPFPQHVRESVSP